MSTYPPAQDAVAVLGPVIGDDAARALAFDEHGLLCAVVQQHDTLEVLMVAWMDAEALRRTLTTRRATYWTRSRGEYWVKGDTSGHTQAVVDVRHDCDGDSILLLVDQVGAACHTGTRSCYDPTRSLLPDAPAG